MYYLSHFFWVILYWNFLPFLFLLFLALPNALSDHLNPLAFIFHFFVLSFFSITWKIHVNLFALLSLSASSLDPFFCHRSYPFSLSQKTYVRLWEILNIDIELFYFKLIYNFYFSYKFLDSFYLIFFQLMVLLFRIWQSLDNVKRLVEHLYNGQMVVSLIFFFWLPNSFD